MSDIDKPDPLPEPWELAAMDVPMTLADISAVKAAFAAAGQEIPEGLQGALDRASGSLEFIRDLTSMTSGGRHARTT
jgi:hypothetical protein